MSSLVSGLRHREPADPVDLGEDLDTAGAFGPFEFEGIAVRIGKVKIASHRERGDDLAAGLLQRCELDPRAGRRRQADLLFEFALRDCPRVFAFAVLALGYRPGAVILASPKRSARMPDQDFDDVVAHPIQQQSCAQLGHRRLNRSDTDRPFQIFQ